MEWPPAFKGSGRPPPVVSAVPPPLLFFRCATADKQQAYFFIWSCLRRTWLKGLSDAPYGTPECMQYYLTRHEWRQMLSGERFKKAARNLGREFDLRHFWSYDPFLWKDGCVPEDICPLLRDGTSLTPHHFLDSNPRSFNLKRLLCYDIALTHAAFQFEETDEIYMREKNMSADSLAMRRSSRLTLFNRLLDVRICSPAWEHRDDRIKASWFDSFRLFLLDWPPVYAHRPHRNTSLRGLKGTALSREIISLLQVYYTGVIKALNTIPTLMWTYPGIQGLSKFLTI
jgi:hypothetical protein